jgi:hypothetical protein
MIFIEGSIALNVEDKQVDIQLSTILDKIEASYVDIETKFESDGIEVILDIPCITYYAHIDELFISTIKSVKIADDIVEFNTISKE